MRQYLIKTLALLGLAVNAFADQGASIEQGVDLPMTLVMQSKMKLVRDNRRLYDHAEAFKNNKADFPVGLYKDLGNYACWTVIDKFQTQPDGLHYLIALIELIPRMGGDTLRFISNKIPFGSFNIVNSSPLRLSLVDDVSLLHTAGLQVLLKGGANYCHYSGLHQNHARNRNS